MSITQTYYFAHRARAKLLEAAQRDHKLRLLVGHANLLDSLMNEIFDAKREHESWLDKFFHGSSRAEERHIKWVDTVVEGIEFDGNSEDDESDSQSESSSNSDSDSESEDDA